MSASRNTKRLAQGRKNRLIDIDGTVSDDIDNEDSHLYPFAKEFEGAAERINSWYDAGDIIIFFTAREEKDRQVTEDWLRSHGFKYHYLLMGKPRGGNYYWLDNLDGEYEKFTGSWKDVRG